MPVHEITSNDQYEGLLSSSGGKLVVIDFYATWCGPCKIMGPKFTKMSDSGDFDNVVFIKVDVDENEDVTANFDIKVMPTFIFLKNGKQVDIVEGSMEDDLRGKLAKHK